MVYGSSFLLQQIWNRHRGSLLPDTVLNKSPLATRYLLILLTEQLSPAPKERGYIATIFTVNYSQSLAVL